MFKIGEFSKLSKVPVKTLRYYHEIGLLEPARIDRFSGYRYYAAEQMARLNRILALKDLGFSLEQIGRMLDEDLSAAEISGLLKMRRAAIAAEVAQERARLARVETRIKQIEMEHKMTTYEVVIKQVEPLQVAYLRDTIANYASVGVLYGELFRALGRYGIPPSGPGMAIYYDESYREKDVDAAAVVPVGGGTLPAEERVSIQELPGGSMAVLVHHGPYDDFSSAYQVLMHWIQENGYRITGPNREIYLQGPDNSASPADYVTEIQFPVEKAGN